MQTSRKTSKTYWDTYYTNVKPMIAAESDFVRQWIERHFLPVPETDKKTCIEIGCYPGAYLSVFGKLGYELYGIDYCDKIDHMVASLKGAGYSVGRLWKEDFLRFDPQQKFDVVASFGFVEHFTNFSEVLEKHISLLNNQGYLVIEVPNFIGGFQHWLHHNFDKSNYDRHYIPAMDIEKWLDILDGRNFKIIYKGYFGEFEFWTNWELRNRLENSLLSTLGKLRPFLRRVLPKDKRMYSPFGGVIAQKQ